MPSSLGVYILFHLVFSISFSQRENLLSSPYDVNGKINMKKVKINRIGGIFSFRPLSQIYIKISRKNVKVQGCKCIV